MTNNCEFCKRHFADNLRVWMVDGRLMCSESCCERWIQEKSKRAWKALSENLPTEVVAQAIIHNLEATPSERKTYSR